MHRLTIVVLGLLALVTPAAAGTSAADTLLVDLPEIVVRSARSAPVHLDRTRLDLPEVRRQDPASLADLGGLLPSVRVTVNSRGDAHAMVRGAPERHVQTYLDGIPLNLPWDERVDLQMIPAVGIDGVEGRRGVVSLLDGPGALAGSVRLLPPLDGYEASTVRAAAGDGGRGQLEARHQRQLGAWHLMGAGAWHTRDHWNLPDGGHEREGSHLDHTSILLRAARALDSGGRVSLLATGWTADKGVPPELHLGQDARFWRYPVSDRLLLGSVASLPLGSDWGLGAMLATDWHRQEIDARGPDGWDTPLETGDDYEKSWDRTAHARVRLTRWLGQRATVAVQTSARYTHHREIAAVGDPTLRYAQWLVSATAEGEITPAAGWTLRLGAGLDHAATPEAGDKSTNPASEAAALNARVVRELAPGRAVHLAASRRSRFPSLREAYSGALGRFVPNPDLGAERQDLLELGGTLGGRGWSVEAGAFTSRLSDGIERVAVDERRYQRVNRGRIDVEGLELRGRWSPGYGVDLHAQHTLLDAHVKDDGQEQAAEDRPAYLSRAELAWSSRRGPGLALESRVTGPRWSADGTAPDGLRRLPAGVTWHLRASWRLGMAELHARMDNVFDARVDHQTGLPAPGRQISGGVRVDW